MGAEGEKLEAPAAAFASKLKTEAKCPNDHPRRSHELRLL